MKVEGEYKRRSSMIFYNQKKTFLLLSLFFTVAYTGFLVDQAIAQNPTARVKL